MLKTKRMKKLFSLILLLSFSIKAQDVTIGSQTWTTKNLNLTKYRNGDAIPEVQDEKAWENLTTGAWCYYENKTANGSTYGKLYNWHAVNDPRGLAPKGYHIPTDAEWTTLTDNLGGLSIAGTKMKSTSGWENGGGTNTSGFFGLPGGQRLSNGTFLNIFGIGQWYSSTEVDNSEGGIGCCAWSRRFLSEYGFVSKASGLKGDGYTVRCLMD